MATTTLPPPPRKTANPAPQRPARSIRRTCSIDVSWPDGDTGDRLFIGRVRDYRTPEAGKPGTVIEEAEYRARLAQERRDPLVEAVDRRILVLLLVADHRRRHRCAHRRVGPGLGVGKQVDPPISKHRNSSR